VSGSDGAPLSPQAFVDRLREEGVRRYHDQHPFHQRMHAGTLSRAELQAWMIKAWKAIIDTNGHYARPDLLRLSLTNQTHSQYPVILHTQPRPDLLAEAAERNGVEPARVESMLHDVAHLPAAG